MVRNMRVTPSQDRRPTLGGMRQLVVVAVVMFSG
jgi:hypothetical protein